MAFLRLESRYTALFTIFALRGSSGPTEVFRLCLYPKFGSKMPKMAILTHFLVFLSKICLKLPILGHFWRFC